MSSKSDRKLIPVNDLVLQVKKDCNREVWNEDDYEEFLTLLCGSRRYQKEAILVALRYLLSNEYDNLRQLATENWNDNPLLHDYYGTFRNFENSLQFSDKLSATIDLATATGKSYVIYGIASILLSEGIVDKVIVLCPSTTIEKELYSKFKWLSAREDLISAIPDDKTLSTPKVIQANQTITNGCICVENRDAIYSHVSSSIDDSLKSGGRRVAILNDEAHHVANAPKKTTKRWKEFLENEEHSFKYILGFSGTCYVDDKYFSDVIYRYSLKEAIENKFVKKVKYLAELDKTGEEGEVWQLRMNMHDKLRDKLVSNSILPLSIIVTRDIRQCESVASELINLLCERHNESYESIKEKVLVVYSGSLDVCRMVDLDSPDSKVEWIVSVSMLNEGWDVKRVFQIIPHEERAFNSKLLVSQVLGRGLRIPEGYKGDQPEVIVLNHSAWAHRIQSTVDEILENERFITSKVYLESEYNFELHNLDYSILKSAEKKEKKGKFELLAKGFVDIPMEADEVQIKAQLESALDHKKEIWQTEIKRKTYKPEVIARQMYNILIKYDEESRLIFPENPTSYSKEFSYDMLLTIVNNSLHGLEYCTESNRQKFLQSLGTLKRRETIVARYELEPENIFTLSTKDRPNERGTASQLRRDRVAFVPNGAKSSLEDEQLDFFEELIEAGGDYKCVQIDNKYDFKSPVNLMFTDSVNEKRFVLELTQQRNCKHIDSWLKSTSNSFYSIDYAWKKGTTPKRSKFNPDFFLKINNVINVIEIKDDEEVREPSIENVKKYQYAVQHFENLNSELNANDVDTIYHFHFLSPMDYPDFFKALREGYLSSFRSKLDVKLASF
ncbi:TPA: DEAD/DEAH box helicase family protein [Vibrio parahaemolyticus]|nr:DEAD/DEAH box helicase family protein [Vibrio parahaemolyticus]